MTSVAKVVTIIGSSPESFAKAADAAVQEAARTIRGITGELKPHQRLIAEIVGADGSLKRVPLIARIDTLEELDYFKNGGILHYVLRRLAA